MCGCNHSSPEPESMWPIWIVGFVAGVVLLMIGIPVLWVLDAWYRG